MAGTPRKGDQPKNWRATDPKTSGHQPKNWSGRRYFFNLNVGGHVPGIFFNTDGIHWLSFPVPFTLLEIVVVDFHGDMFEVSSLCPTMRCWSGFVYGVRGWLMDLRNVVLGEGLKSTTKKKWWKYHQIGRCSRGVLAVSTVEFSPRHHLTHWKVSGVMWGHGRRPKNRLPQQ